MASTEKTKKTLNIIGNVVFWVVLALVVFYSALSLFSSREDNMTSLFGISGLTVQSDSMSPTFDQGDLIFIDTSFTVEDLEVGDVITYIANGVDDEGTPYTYFNSHRIKTITPAGTAYWFTTQGDNPDLPVDPQAVVGNDIIGVWTEVSWAGFGTGIDWLIGFLKSTLGFFLFIVLPCFGFLIYEVLKFVKVVSEYNVQKALGDRSKMQEEALAMARAQLEAEQKQKLEAEQKKE